ncbi:sulfate adenylyltransferase subunit 1 [Chishuiella changwenlii]|uniref:sulfate adenylyltransferase n=1 Tax=Chishuiella changwenlii TaxID=1434701 RepID=A0A1M6Y794_9FLAO|nr:GTP-binding protein [Chishuiella changwenlii]GGE93274.1 sulfate adenylyltransferase subunit 1 [Chishuiella changwenlii]SHL14136.1 sulfate adenylyltransferase subunit 1 [Chishuiella changwenlii]
MNTLKFITAGNVDDGKSTLIGRLLYDSNSIHTDQLGVLEKRKSNDSDEIDLSLITDGLRAEREQGITIDVAYKYFSTSKRKFIIADAPGHEQYTRNMITGASNSELIIILIDARKGITSQTKRHASIGSLMGIKKAIVAVNKIDLVDYSEDVFHAIKTDFEALKDQLNYDEIVFVPVSALVGDNIVDKSPRTPWYKGENLLHLLETISIDTNKDLPARFQVQWVIRPKDEQHHDYRGYAGQVLSGTYKVGDSIKVFPSNIESKIIKIERHLEEVDHAVEGENIVIHLENNIDISRGDTIVKISEEPVATNEPKAWICWLDNQSLQPGKTYELQHRFHSVRTKVREIDQQWDINNWNFIPTDEVKLNDIAQVTLKTNQPLFYDLFEKNNKTGNAILIDETTKNTVAAVMFI